VSTSRVQYQILYTTLQDVTLKTFKTVAQTTLESHFSQWDIYDNFWSLTSPYLTFGRMPPVDDTER